MPERDRLRQGVIGAVREVVVHQVRLADPGRVAEREHLHLLDQASPHHQVVAIEPERQSLPVQDLLADEVRHRPVRLRCRGRPAPLPFQMLIQPPALGRGHHDVTIRPRSALQPERDLLLLSLIMVMTLTRHSFQARPAIGSIQALNTSAGQPAPTRNGNAGSSGAEDLLLLRAELRLRQDCLERRRICASPRTVSRRPANGVGRKVLRDRGPNPRRDPEVLLVGRPPIAS